MDKIASKYRISEDKLNFDSLVRYNYYLTIFHYIIFIQSFQIAKQDLHYKQHWSAACLYGKSKT